MFLARTEANISLNMGVLDIMRSVIKSDKPHAPSIFYDDKYQKMVKIYKDVHMLCIEAKKAGIYFRLDIDNLEYSNVKVGVGGIGSTAIAYIAESYAIKTGAIKLIIRKAEIGDLIMRVGSGLIVAIPSLIKVTPLGESGCEAYYKGGLIGQKTELFVESGAILCIIL